jgi:hypothetical protein
MTTNAELPVTDAAPAASTGARTEAFKEEVKGLKIKDPNANRESALLKLGVVIMLVGVIVAIVSYFVSHNTNSSLEQNDALTIGLIGVAVTVLGAAMFLRYSFGAFMRFWLARLIFEQQNRD